MPGESDGGIDIDSVATKKMKETEKIDNHIFDLFILGVDITEVYSLDRGDEVAKRHGLVPGSSLDLTKGWDFTKPEHSRAAWRKIKTEDPYLIIGSPPCTLFSMFQQLSIRNHVNKPGWIEEFKMRKVEATEHIRFCCVLHEYQLRQGRHVLHKHP